MKKCLILGGGVAGVSVSYFLNKKGYKTTIIEKNSTVGGLSRTMTYGGHLYDFGIHVWFYPGGLDDPINQTIHEVSEGKYYHVSRHLKSYVEKDNKFYNYPIHYLDISNMPEEKEIKRELRIVRKADKLISTRIPELGKCSFEDYFTATIGSTLYNKFMRDYTEKMWGIPGNKLQTDIIWADRLKDNYEKTPYDPLKYGENVPLADGTFCIYPKGGWSWVWNRMSEGTSIIHSQIDYLTLSKKLKLKNSETINLKDYDIIISTISPDSLFGVSPKIGAIPYMGRMIIPILLPVPKIFPGNIESFHYSGAEPVTRITEMKVITRQNINGTLLIIEVPVTGDPTFLPNNVVQFLTERNLYEKRCYPEQSKYAKNIYNEYMKYKKGFDNLFFCGRLGEFKYMGMAETIKSAYDLVKGL